MTYTELRFDGIRDRAIFNYKYHATGYVFGLTSKEREFVIGLIADGAVRAMLENENRTRLGRFQKLFNVLDLSKFKDHCFRLADPT